MLDILANKIHLSDESIDKLNSSDLKISEAFKVLQEELKNNLQNIESIDKIVGANIADSVTESKNNGKIIESLKEAILRMPSDDSFQDFITSNQSEFNDDDIRKAINEALKEAASTGDVIESQLWKLIGDLDKSFNPEIAELGDKIVEELQKNGGNSEFEKELINSIKEGLDTLGFLADSENEMVDIEKRRDVREKLAEAYRKDEMDAASSSQNQILGNIEKLLNTQIKNDDVSRAILDDITDAIMDGNLITAGAVAASGGSRRGGGLFGNAGAGVAGFLGGKMAGSKIPKILGGIGKKLGLIGVGLALFDDALDGVKDIALKDNSRTAAAAAAMITGGADASTLGNAIKVGTMGAMAGAAIGGPVGAVIGGALGAVIGGAAANIDTKWLADKIDGLMDAKIFKKEFWIGSDGLVRKVIELPRTMQDNFEKKIKSLKPENIVKKSKDNFSKKIEESKDFFKEVGELFSPSAFIDNVKEKFTLENVKSEFGKIFDEEEGSFTKKFGISFKDWLKTSFEIINPFAWIDSPKELFKKGITKSSDFFKKIWPFGDDEVELSEKGDLNVEKIIVQKDGIRNVDKALESELNNLEADMKYSTPNPHAGGVTQANVNSNSGNSSNITINNPGFGTEDSSMNSVMKRAFGAR